MSGDPWFVALHGTAARARRHYRDGERPCEACRIAANQQHQIQAGERRARRRAQAQARANNQAYLLREAIALLAEAMLGGQR